MVECPECRMEVEMEADDEFCPECGYEFTAADRAATTGSDAKGKYENYVIGVIVEVEQMKDKKYKAVTVDVGAEAAVAVVTNAKHADVGERVVVAMVGAIVPAGADPEDAITVAKASVGGRASCGMLCDATMLGWKGANGVAVKLGEDFAIGAPPPDAKPGQK
eukprot:m.416256 g.416256  ORF g.416256 m.416256 type:complete len:163 (-) comp29894_c0_seq1:1274-1762(-)